MHNKMPCTLFTFNIKKIFYSSEVSKLRQSSYYLDSQAEINVVYVKSKKCARHFIMHKQQS